MVSSGRPTRIAALGPVFLAAACQQILGIPNPDDAQELSDVGAKLCGCPNLQAQGAEVVSTCNQSIEKAEDELLRSIAESDCRDCDNASACYELATGAEGNPGDGCDPAKGCGVCTTHAGCGSFACCFGGFASIGEMTSAAGTCCDHCYGCGDLINEDVPEDLQICVESYDTIVDVIVCACDYVNHYLPCVVAGRCEDRGLPNGVDLTYCQTEEADCQVCLFEQANGACAEYENACLNDHGRPFQAGGG
ncbi:MAG: hypothetical protein HOV80_28320 [Polyangiaceae bacterium]|nr:hypothetical protein [Polyangiaceae bacterium]